VRRTPALAAALVAAVAAVAAVLATAPAARAGAGERIHAYDVRIVVERDGSLLVTETIDYDFASARDRHGILRDVPVRFHYDGRYDRLTPLEVVSVDALPPGTPDDVAVLDQGPDKRIRIGHPDRTVSGRHTYTIVYRVRGALNTFPDHEELFWNVTGNGWAAPIAGVTARVEAPGQITQVACYAGPEGSQLACDQADQATGAGTFSHGALGPFEGLTVVVGMAKGSLTVPPPILDERWSVSRAFSVTPLTVGLSLAATVVLLFGLVRLVWTRGRDRRWRGSHVDVVFGNVAGEDEPVPIRVFDQPLDPVEFEPPDGVLPGQVGTLMDEVANPLDVTATVVHLAVRGYLRIEEIPKQGWFGKPDWRLVKLRSADGLHEYERLLHNGLFQGGKEEVTLSSLKRTFAARLKRVQDALYDDVVAQGWFVSRPDRARGLWLGIGIGALVLAIGVLVVLAAFTHLGLLGLPLIVFAVGLIVSAQWLPRRTPKGVATTRRVNGFRRFIEESEAERARFAERANLFSEYLPYAIVFGATEKWARAFEGLDDAAAAATSSWYVSSRPFSVGAFSDSMDSFAVTTSGTIVTTAASAGSSGFGGGGSSGGGFGGGGGGSW
jgi:hypothetical protein